jgi:sulfite reductase (NADPH) flavoprotein alpha-component
MKNNKLNILYGSRTGNSKAVADLASNYASHLGIPNSCESMMQFDFNELSKINNLLVVVSTHGEGDPPAPAEEFYRNLHGDEAPGLPDMDFAVLALGDSSYKYFCKTGNDIAARLEQLGAHPYLETEECDIDFEEKSKLWVKKVVDEIQKQINNNKESKKPEDFVFELRLDELDKYNAFNATILKKELISGDHSSKRTYHLRLTLKNSGIHFKPGDSIGMYVTNSKLFVDRIIRRLNFDPTYPVKISDQKKLLKEALVKDFELTIITPVVVKKYAELTKNHTIIELVNDKTKLDEYVQTRDVLDLITDFPARINPDDFLSILRKLAPRLYSVASSDKVADDSVDLTVGIIEFDAYHGYHIGVGSSMISQRLDQGEKVPVFLEANEKFHTPDQAEVPIVMIATGTGIAPFRGFLQERELQRNSGKNWLFFGERSSTTDFLYRDEIEQYQKSGVLTRLDTAFSRDGEKKTYITHKMIENSSELYDWINNGAVIYVCGNKRTMAKSVRKTLKDIISREAGISASEANRYFERMKTSHQYREDVY